MQFKDVLSDIEKLVGKELQSINPKTAPIFLTEVDHELQKYFVAATPNAKGFARAFRELEDIWKELTLKGFSNVDQALFGGGTSRNQPETVFAHLPYIQHFKYQKRKHLLLRGCDVHELGKLSELTASELRSVTIKIRASNELSNRIIMDSLSQISGKLRSSLDTILVKYPSDANVKAFEKSFLELGIIENTIRSGVVSLEAENVNLAQNEPLSNLMPSINDIDGGDYVGFESDDEGYVAAVGKPRIRQYTPTISLIFDRLIHNEIELQPDFQRKDRIWDDTKKSRLIESILMELPLPVFYFGEKRDGTWIVIDGVQRITSVYDYIRGMFKLSNKLEARTEFRGVAFKELDRTHQRRILEYAVTSHLIDMTTGHEDLVVELFHRINTYGVKLSTQEIRSALNQGSSVTFLRYIAATFEFKSVTNLRIKPERQKDMELCLSAVAFIILGYKEYKKDSYDKYLSDSMIEINKCKIKLSNDDKVDQGEAIISEDPGGLFKELEHRIKKAFSLAEFIFGDLAFKKSIDAKAKDPISKPLFELIISYFSQLSSDEVEIVKSKRENLLKLLYASMNEEVTELATWNSDRYAGSDRGFLYSISTSTGKNVTVKYRFEAFREILKQSTGLDIKQVPLKEIIQCQL
ncbi:DUF262 domain-containing protein [Vibrio lentus]|uniref:DUF262 domain-containing protein n=1 Tax=Vibrio lentus TaxID=136468 RepID=A0A4U2FCE2_9VIBR|nr:DUF262 domain-containing protein [Vibrio lentus]TKG13283.1 DUF262 domain-containing protein [Vibrio lentus]